MAEYSGIPTAPDAPEIVARSSQETIRPGQIIAGRYEVVSRLGAGGMGAVFRVHDQVLDEFIALKVILSTALGDPRSIERMRAEVKLARKITHPNVCRVFDVGEDHGLIFLTMELIEGTTLRQAMVAKTITPEKAEDYFRQIVAGVAAAHEQGVVHRDLKPENILLRKDERCVVADFGLAQGLDSAILRAGEKAGTLAYMSPEQKRGDPLDVRSDVYALGLIGRELLGANPGLTEALEKALAEHPQDRYATAGELAIALEKVPGTFEDAAAPPASISDVALRELTSVELSGPKNESKIQRLPVQAKSRKGLVAASLVILTALFLAIFATNRTDIPEQKMLATTPSSTTSALSVPAGRAVVVVLPFDDLAHQSNSAGLMRSAPESIRAALRTLPEVTILDGDSANNATATFSVRGNVQLVGERLRLFAQMEPIGSVGDVPPSEPVEVDVEGDAGAALDSLRSKLLDEARIVLGRFRRWHKAESGTANSIARDKLHAYYRLIGPSPRSEHYEPGLRLLEEAIAADSDYVPARIERVFLWMLGAIEGTGFQRYEKALAELNQILAKHPGQTEALVMRCRVAQGLVERVDLPQDAAIERAMTACSEALMAAPTSGHVQITMGRIYDRRCDDEKALQSFSRAMEEDRSLSGRALGDLLYLAQASGQVLVAERASSELLAFQQEEERLGLRAMSRRAGAPATRRAYVARGGVLLALGRFSEAKEVFSRELARTTETRGDPVDEATAIRGLLRVAKEEKKTIPAGLTMRLESIERPYRDRIRTNPEGAEVLARTYQFVDPVAAADWIELLGAPQNCENAIQRGLIYLAAGRKKRAEAMIGACSPTQQWEKQCLNVFSSRLGN